MEHAYFTPRRQEILTVLLTGLFGTALMMLIAWATATFLIEPVLCRDSNATACAHPLNLGYNISLILGALIAIGWFARERVFRPALVALPPVLLFWSLPQLFGTMSEQSPYLFFALVSLLVAISYVVFYWVLRVRNFVIAFILLLLVMFGLRWFIAS
ncbi:hypothetical protein JNJ66_02845 [Candidatus Saccharibacteria bacterium]|nr:hypothetical protein [Candidatus Saccharibacteria bacterium]